jgi:hypothetical protein
VKCMTALPKSPDKLKLKREVSSARSAAVAAASSSALHTVRVGGSGTRLASCHPTARTHTPPLLPPPSPLYPRSVVVDAPAVARASGRCGRHRPRASAFSHEERSQRP